MKKFLLLFLVMILLTSFFILLPTSQKNKPLFSRLWMEVSQDLVREKKPTPPEAAAHVYAFMATSYYETLLATGSSTQAGLAAATVLTQKYPDKKDFVFEKFKEIHQTNPYLLSSETSYITDSFKERLIKDLAQPSLSEQKEGAEFWVGKNPFAPNAPLWQRFYVGTTDFGVPPPPLYGSEEYKKSVKEVKEFAEKRDADWSAKINFWGGVPGSESPAGIWQERLFVTTQEYSFTDKEYAYAQMILAQTLADAFMECWEIKYTYWTKRPDMEDPSIPVAMQNPNFPSYTSGHSTISRAAAEALGVLFPEKREIFIKDAEDARDSRLYAGIHFSYDNNQGFILGQKIGEYIVKKESLTSLKK